MLFVYGRKIVLSVGFIAILTMVNFSSCGTANNSALTENDELISYPTESIEDSVGLLPDTVEETSDYSIEATKTEDTMVTDLLEDNSIMTDESNNYQGNIDEIYVGHSAWGELYCEYIIDLKNKKCWKYRGDYTDPIMRDHSAENEGFTFVKDLRDEDIAAFIDASIEYGFILWNEHYHDEMVIDGTSRSITITFSDGSQKEIGLYVDNKEDYPKTWNEMQDAFKALTGEEILYN